MGSASQEKQRLGPVLQAALSGVLLVLAFPSAGLHWLAWGGLVPLLWATRHSVPWQAFCLGSVAGTVFHLGLIYWVTVSMTAYGGLHPIPALGVLLLLSLLLSIFVSVPLALSRFVERKSGWQGFVTLPLLWTAAEHVKSWFLTGFPWGNLGYTQYDLLPVIQISDTTGVYGISFLLVLANTAGFSLLQAAAQRQRPPLGPALSALVLLAATLLYGHYRLSAPLHPSGPARQVAVIQPNIPQNLKWDPGFLEPTLAIYRRLTLEACAENPELIVWPESATPFFFSAQPEYRQAVEEIVGQTDAYLLLGSPALEQTPGGEQYFNSAYLIAPDGTVRGRYDKLHLVPWGEYVPLQQLFPFVSRMVAGIGDFSPGAQVRLLDLPDCPIGAVICYEIIFPDLVRRVARSGARVLVNITNDAWFGLTSAPHQHLAMAVLRAVENRRCLVRSANTGISAFISPRGAITARTGLFTQAVLPAMIESYDGMTFYTRHGDVFAWLCCAAGLLLLVRAGLRKDI